MVTAAGTMVVKRCLGRRKRGLPIRPGLAGCREGCQVNGQLQRVALVVMSTPLTPPRWAALMAEIERLLSIVVQSNGSAGPFL